MNESRKDIKKDARVGIIAKDLIVENLVVENPAIKDLIVTK